MADCSGQVSQQAAEANLQNLKAIVDRFVNAMQQGTEDNQSDARAWAALKLRVANNAESFDHAVRMGSVLAGQAGVTEQQQTVSPVRTGTGDAIVGGVGVAGEQVAANIANFNEVALKFAEAMNALAGVVVTAAGGASTPSQTQPKPTA